MSRVTLTHPDLPGQPIEVNAAAVPHYQASGWQVAQNPTAETTTSATTTTPATSRRRTPKKDES